MSAYKLIKVKQVEKDAEKKDEKASDKMQDLIVQSNLLSGGIENRFLTLFSSEAQSQLQDLIRISNDTALQKLLSGKPSTTDQDKLCMSIIYEGRDINVDRVISYL
jgi:hypothetical protein